ncbi:MAG: hypothetical protein J6V20_00275 [Bacteroidaceae bacterium]|nr:hypothetical protein [Bacteroidaceae bacterium]
MIFENSDNEKKRKKSTESVFHLSDNVLLSDGMDEMKKRTTEKLDYLTTPTDPHLQEKRFNRSFTNYMLPTDTPERHRRNYALSGEALDSVVGDYYNNSLKGTFDKKREASKEKERSEYMRYAAVPGANPVDAYKASVRVNDPLNVVDETMKSVDDDELLKNVAPLASYGGYDAKEYVDKFVKPSLREKLVKEYIDESTPKSSAEYIMRSAFDNSLMGKVGNIGMNSDKASKNNRLIASEGLANYDANRFENFAAGVGSLLVDMPVFSGLGSLSSSIVGGRTAKAMEKISANVLSRYKDRIVSKKFADGVARKVVLGSLKNRIMQGAATQGLTLGGYDVANSVADDILYNGSVDVGKAAGAFTKGFATGAAVGATGTALKSMTKGLTGGKKLLSSAGVLSAESAVFTAGAEVDKLIHGVEIKPIDLINDFGESTATLITMRLANWRPKGAAQKLDNSGKIKDGLKLSNSELQEIREANVNPEEFVSMLERELSMPTLGASGARLLKENYATLMSNKNLSASAKSKLMYLMENKITSTPPLVFDYDVQKNVDGTWKVNVLDAGGGVVEKLHFPNAGNAKSYLLLRRGGYRKNRIAYYEKELSSATDSQNFLHETGLYANEKGVDADIIAEAMYKRARNEKLDNVEEFVIDEILERASRNESQISKRLADARRNIEEHYGLDKGTLSYAVDKRFVDCSAAENSALDAYESFVRSEYENSKKRNTPAPVSDVVGEYASNEDNRLREAEEYRRARELKHKEQGGNESVQKIRMEVLREIPENRPGYVWNASGRELKKETVEEFEKRGKEFSKKFGQDITFITDEHQLKRPDSNDADAVREYNNQLRATGWVHDGKVYINLPNIKDYAELESTIVHEVVGHVGLKKLFGRYMYDFIEDVYKTSDGSVRNGIEKMKDVYRGADMYAVTEEYLAHLVEKAYPNSQERNLLVKFKDFIKGMLVRKNIYKQKYRRVSEKDLESIMKAHCRYVINNRNASQHRSDVFSRFKSAQLDDAVYDNPQEYARKKTDMILNEEYMKWTPEKLRDAKYLVNYPFLPESTREKIVENTGMSDEALRKQSEMANYRFEGKKGAANYSKVYPDKPGRSLEDAEVYEKHGLSPWYIKRVTGWERGADGQWRREVAENLDIVRDYVYDALLDTKPELIPEYKKIKEKPLKEWSMRDKLVWEKIVREGKMDTKKVVLDEVVGDDDFFVSYPELASVPVRIVNDVKTPARYDSKNKVMLLDQNIFISPYGAEYLSSALQNLIQDYEGFGKGISLRLMSLEGRLANSYKEAQKSIALLDGVRKANPSFDNGEQIERAFYRQYGMDMDEFKRMFPTYDDYLFYKLTGKNYSFSGNVEANNVRKRFFMDDKTRRNVLAETTEAVPRSRQIVINELSDLEKYFNGPLDVINKYVRERYSDKPVNLHLLEQRLNNANLSPYELAELEKSLDRYTKALLRDMLNGKKEDKYGYEEFVKKFGRLSDEYEKVYREFYNKQLDKNSGKNNPSDLPN